MQTFSAYAGCYAYVRRDSFLLEPNLYSMAVQHLCVIAAVDNVSGEPLDALHQNKIYLLIKGVLHHFLESLTLFRIHSTNSLIGIDSCIFPVGITENV